MPPTPFSKSRNQNRRGMSLIEIDVAAAILILLFGAIVLIYQVCAKVWRKVDIRTGLLRELQVAVRYLERGLEVTHPYGLARAENALAYLSATDEDDNIVVGGNGGPAWQKFVIFYVDADGRLRRRLVELSTPETDPPTFRESLGAELSDYLVPNPDDRHLTHSGTITLLSLENAGNYGSLFELVLQAEQLKESDQVEKLEVRTKVSIRN